MECSSVRELIIRYSSGDIVESEKSLVNLHIKECGSCEKYFMRSEKLWSTLDAWDEIEPAGEFVTKFWDKVSMEEDKTGGLLGWFRGFRPKLAVSGALATVFIVGVFTFALLGPGTLEDVFRSGDERDEMMLSELDRATNSEASELLAIYGPWDNSYGAGGNGGMN